MKTILIAGALALACATAAYAKPVAGRADVDDQSSVRLDGSRVLKESILIHAPREKAWEAFATTAGLVSWEAPVAAIDLRVGGYLEASYDEHGKLGDPNNIKHEIIAFTPGRKLVFHNVQAPQGFPNQPLFGKIRHTLTFEDAGPGVTRVTITDVAYGKGAGYDQLYSFFHSGNAYVLELLKAHLEGTPPPTGPAH
ncbi:MAG TPA: SRPBCC domain-containing protein [Caulobacteraceae bacterium]|jgi:uncharacterized protein YndB with AHSA1/START domain